MFCRNCQTIIPDDSIFCENCGAPTGLNPDEIEVKNLVPEDAVEFEVSEDAPQVASVPVDPVWWEPPEKPAEEGSWDDWDETEEINEQGSQAEPEIQEPAAEPAEEKEPAEAESDEAEHHDRVDLKEMAAEAAEQAKPYLEKAKSMLGGLGKNVRTGTGWAAEKVKQQLQHKEEEAAEAEEDGAGAPAETPQPQEPEARTEWQEPEAPAEWQESDAPGAYAEPETSEEPAEPETPVEPRTSEVTIEPYDPEEEETYEPEAEEPYEPVGTEEPYEPEEPYAPYEPEEPEDLYEPFEPEEPAPAEPREAEEPGEDAESQVKPYLDKAMALLGDLGKNVRTGTERAAEAAKQQFQQKKEEFEEKRELREKEKAEERQREEEQRQKDEEARRLAEQERQEELERRREQDEREQEEDMLQRPGFWYGQQETEEIEEAGASGETEPAKGSELAALIAEREPEAEAKAEEPETGAEVEFEPEAEPEAEPEFEPEAEPEFEPEAEPEIEPEVEPEPEAEPLPEHEIEDKLADTARFTWSEEELKEAAENGVEPDIDKAADEGSREEGASEGEEGASGENGEDKEPEESSPYRIKDYEPYEAKKKKQPFFSKDKIRLIVVIAIAAAIVASIAGVMIHQAHERQLAEEAYARSVKQAEQLVEAKKYDEAEAQYLKLMEQRPEDTQLYVELAQMYVDQQRYVDAKALIKRAIKITGDKEAFKQLKKDIKILTSNKWKKAYIEVLEDNESEIRRYEDRVQASCAICDVNGDMKPELFFFTGEYYGYGKLHIYTTVDNKAKEVEYECENQRTQYDDAFYDVAPNDSSYAIFNSSEVGKFSIYANIVRSGDSRDTTNEYNLNLNGGCRRVNLLEGTIDTTYSEGENDDSEYQLNGEEITYNKYIGEFKRVLDEAKQVILYSGSDDSGGDQAVWGKINPDTVMCMSYDALMVDLKAK